MKKIVRQFHDGVGYVEREIDTRKPLLVNEKTGAVIKIGDTVTTFRGEKATLINWTAPSHEGSTGRVYIKMDEPGKNAGGG